MRTASLPRSSTADTAPATRLPGGVSGARGCGRVGAALRASSSAPAISFSSLGVKALRTLGKSSFSSSFTWWRMLSISTFTFASKRSASAGRFSSSLSVHLATWCSSSASSTSSSSFATLARTAG